MPIDYDQIAPHYDKHRYGDGPYLQGLLRLLDDCAGNRVLELGAGTGNVTARILEEQSYSLTALDRSPGMLSRAREKQLPVSWVRGDARALPFVADAFDFIFATFLLHYISDLETFMQECARVLGHGCVAFVTAPHGFIQQHPLNTYFPSFARIDLARFQPVEEIEIALRKAGFNETGFEYCKASPVAIDATYLGKIESKMISTLELVPEAEFNEGMARLKAEVHRLGSVVDDHVWECVLVWGII